MSKEATIIQSFNDIKRQYEYSVKGYDVTESVKILLKKHKEAYDKEKNVFAGIDGYLEAQKEYQSQIADLQSQLAEKEKQLENAQNLKAIEVADELSLKLIKIHNQDKISFTVEQLEKVKEKILSYENVYYRFLESGAKVPVVCLENFRVKQTIDNQIKELKGENK